MRGPLKNPGLDDAHNAIPTYTMAYGNSVQLATTAPIHLDYTRNVLTLQRTAIHGTGTDLTLQGTIPMNGSAPVALLAIGTIDLRLAQMMDPDITSSGQIQFNINSLGQRDNPSVQGQIKVVNATFAGRQPAAGIAERQRRSEPDVEQPAGDYGQFEGTVGSGTLTARGAVTYRPSLQFNLSIAGSGIRMLYPQGVRESVDANLTITGSLQSSVLRGQVRLTDLSFSPTFDLADIVGQTAAPSTVPATGFARNLRLDIGVQSDKRCAHLANSKLSIEGAANLRVRGTLQQNR